MSRTHARTSPAPIAITMGDPLGIGPEIVVKALATLAATAASNGPSASPPTASPQPSRFTVVGDADWLRETARRLGLPAPQSIVDEPIGVRPLPIGRVDRCGGDAAYRCVVRAARMALDGTVRAVVTAPLSKEAMHAAGHDYPGHTELLAELAGGVPVRMMLANPELRVVLVTIHLPLREALARLDIASIVQTIELTNGALRRAGIARPRIAVAGVNPHAGEGGLFGREEIDVVAPAVRAALARGIDASGPHPPDTVFMRARGFAQFDAVVAMYHDQGLIPVKYLGIDDGVNVTVGLPFVRTSPDHGTAFDIAGRGTADPRSLLAAIREADRMSAAAR